MTWAVWSFGCQVVWKIRYHLIIFLLSFFILTRFYFDPDLGWHLAIGNKFLSGGGIIFYDQFSWTMPNYLWGNYFFAYQVIVAYLFKHFGFLILTLVFGFLGSGAAFLLLPKRLSFEKILAVFLGVVVSSTTLSVRPSMVSFFLFAVLIFFLERRFFEKRILAVFWFLFFAVWANFHQGFLAGLFVFLTFATFDFLRKISIKERVDLLPRLFCFLAAVLGTLTTPFHFLIYKAIFLDLSGHRTWVGIAEWQPIVLTFPSNIFFAMSGIVFVFILFRKFRELEPPWFITAAFLFAMAFVVANMIFIWGAIFIFIASRYLDYKLNLKLSAFAKISLIFSCVAVSLSLFLNFGAGILESSNLSNRLASDKYPVAAVEFMKKEDLVSGLFNDYGWGGYIDWFYPEAKVFIDGRMTGWRSQGHYILADYIAVSEGRCDVLLKYDVKIVLVSKSYDTVCFPNFSNIYEDEVAKVLVKV